MRNCNSLRSYDDVHPNDPICCTFNGYSSFWWHTICHPWHIKYKPYFVMAFVSSTGAVSIYSRSCLEIKKYTNVQKQHLQRGMKLASKTLSNYPQHTQRTTTAAHSPCYVPLLQAPCHNLQVMRLLRTQRDLAMFPHALDGLHIDWTFRLLREACDVLHTNGWFKQDTCARDNPTMKQIQKDQKPNYKYNLHPSDFVS